MKDERTVQQLLEEYGLNEASIKLNDAFLKKAIEDAKDQVKIKGKRLTKNLIADAYNRIANEGEQTRILKQLYSPEKGQWPRLKKGQLDSFIDSRHLRKKFMDVIKNAVPNSALK